MTDIDSLKKQIKQDSIALTKNAWEKSPHKKKEELLQAMGFQKSFAKVKTTDELVKRGGGLILKDLHKIVKKWQSQNPNTEVLFK